jgi:SAM-dependent methyltransferase
MIHLGIRRRTTSLLRRLGVLPRMPSSKSEAEFAYWQHMKRKLGSLPNAHYEYFYTKAFGLTTEVYKGKRMLDVGCGPCGSLEWATMSAERVGLDPLAEKYLKLGVNRHAMTYVTAPSEAIPYSSAYFDIVTSFNNLDHVDNLPTTISEIKRVLKPGGIFLLIVEINHQPTMTEPISLTRDVLNQFTPELRIVRSWECRMLPGRHDIYASVMNNDRPTNQEEPSVLCTHLVRTSSSQSLGQC